MTEKITKRRTCISLCQGKPKRINSLTDPVALWASKIPIFISDKGNEQYNPLFYTFSVSWDVTFIFCDQDIFKSLLLEEHSCDSEVCNSSCKDLAQSSEFWENLAQYVTPCSHQYHYIYLNIIPFQSTNFSDNCRSQKDFIHIKLILLCCVIPLYAFSHRLIQFLPTQRKKFCIVFGNVLSIIKIYRYSKIELEKHTKCISMLFVACIPEICSGYLCWPKDVGE